MSDRIIFALIGAIVGGIAGCFIASRFFGKEYKKRIDELEAENKQLRAREKKKKAKDISDREEKARLSEAAVDNSINMQLTMEREARKKAEDMAREHGYSKDDEDDDFDFDEDVNFEDPLDDGEEIIVKPTEDKKPSFTIMSQEDYENDFEYRESESLTYYREDHVLADAFDDRIGNPETLIGREAVIEAESTDGNYVYVLDEVEDKMYEIEINSNESYYRDILRGGV